MPSHLGPWHEMIDYGLTTFVEENSYWRSLCHAWSAHPALEFMERILGVTPRRPGFAEIAIAPNLCGLDHASGKVCTPRGPVSVAWSRPPGKFAIKIEAPAGTPVHLRLPNGASRTFNDGSFTEVIALK